MDIDTAIDRLKLFNEKATKLDGSSFIANTRPGDFTLNIHATPEAMEIQISGEPPSEESTDSFVLTWRMFWTDGDGISFREMADLYNEMPLSTETKHTYASMRKAINDYLDSATMVMEDDHDISRRQVLDTFLYGELAHLNPGQKRRYDRWRKNSILHFARFEFYNTLSSVMKAVLLLRGLNSTALAELDEHKRLKNP